MQLPRRCWRLASGFDRAAWAIQFQLSHAVYCDYSKSNHASTPKETTMKKLTALFAIAALTATAGIAQARDLGPDEALKLRDAGTIQSFDKLNAAALAKHPGATIEETDLEQKNGRYLYELDLRDSKGVQWDLELDATSGEVLKDQQDH
jgi:uncharacterized membrane protein YkoI